MCFILISLTKSLPHFVTKLNDFFFFNDTATTEIYTLSLHDALPISWLATLILSLLFLITLQLENDDRLWKWAAYGALWALCALTSSAVLVVLPFLAAWVIWRRQRIGKRWFAVNAVAAVVFVAVVSPWFIRNY